MLANIGLRELIAGNDEDYTAIALRPVRVAAQQS